MELRLTSNCVHLISPHYITAAAAATYLVDTSQPCVDADAALLAPTHCHYLKTLHYGSLQLVTHAQH